MSFLDTLITEAGETARNAQNAMAGMFGDATDVVTTGQEQLGDVVTTATEQAGDVVTTATEQAGDVGVAATDPGASFFDSVKWIGLGLAGVAVADLALTGGKTIGKITG
jgi:hypothetical protein